MLREADYEVVDFGASQPKQDDDYRGFGCALRPCRSSRRGGSRRGYEVRKRIGAFAAALGGVDTLVFAGGIGENAPLVRPRICDGLGFLGIALNESRNAETAGVISTDASRVTVRVTPTDEDLMIARSVCRVLAIDAGNGKD